MTPVVLLDTGPLGLVTAPPRKADVLACSQWLAGVISYMNPVRLSVLPSPPRGEGGRNGHPQRVRVSVQVRVVVPEITDYELRRELLRAGKAASIRRLDALAQATEYLPIMTDAMRRAAELWAQARQQGQPTAADNTIDADMILAAQALTLGVPAVVIATTNIGHLSRFVPAESWQNIRP